MKKLFTLALISILAPFTTLGMNPSFQEQNNEIPIITSYLEDTDPRIQPNQYIGNPIYATLVPGVMPALNNNLQITNFYLPNNISQPIEPVQFQAYQNQAQFNPMQTLLIAIPIHMQNQPHAPLETTNINQNQSKKRAANYPQQNKRQKIDLPINKFKNLKSTDLNPTSLRLHFEKIYKETFKNNKKFIIKDEVLQRLICDDSIEKTTKNIETLSWAIDCPVRNCKHTTHSSINTRYSPSFHRDLKKHINTKHADNSNIKKIIDEIDQQTISLTLTKKRHQPITSIQDFKDKELLQKFISDNGMQPTKQVMENLSWATDCPINNCKHITRLSINNASSCLYQNVKRHLNAMHSDNPDLQKIINEIKQQKMRLMFIKKKSSKKSLNQLNQNNALLMPNSNNNINVPLVENNQQFERNPDFQVNIQNPYFDDQNQILAFDDFQNPIFDQFNTNQ